jgi:hypothetical protein
LKRKPRTPSAFQSRSAAQRGGRNAGIGHRDAAKAVRLPLQRIQHRRIVASMRAALHQHAARKADYVEHAEIFLERRVRRGVAAVVGIGKKIRRAEHVGVGIAGVRQWRHIGPRHLARRQAGRSCRHHSALMPAALMIGPHFS